MDLLVDRRCVMLDGNCDCPRLEGSSFPECKRYPEPSYEESRATPVPPSTE